MKNGERPTGIVRTLPYFGAGDTEESKAKRLAYRRMMEAFKRVQKDDTGQEHVRIAFSSMPTQEVLHCYVLVEGQVRVRANIGWWERGTGEQVESWDGHDLSSAKYWAILTGPVEFPPEPIYRRGTQGFRYVVEPLW